MTLDTPHRLFVYGTLRDPVVQRVVFGRTVEGKPDAIGGYRIGSVVIRDATVLAVSGMETHVILHPTGDEADRVEGLVLALGDAELAAADAYETDAYRRVSVQARSGARVFVYVAA